MLTFVCHAQGTINLISCYISVQLVIDKTHIMKVKIVFYIYQVHFVQLPVIM